MRARTYNQSHTPRAHTGGRRISIYWTWSYPWEANRDVTELDNRFSTMTEVRRVAWPNYEKPEYSEKLFLQGIEAPRVCRRPFRLSHAAMAGCCSMA